MFMHKFCHILALYLLFIASCADPSCNNSKLKEMPADRLAKNGKIISGKVIGISDGDTFKLLVEGNQTIRIRLYGVDAPEKSQDYSTQAKQKLSDLIFSKRVDVKQINIDRFKRIIGVVYVEDKNVNEELLRSGYVWHYTQYSKNEQWAKLQREAQKKRIGLWSKANPTPPWQWRKEKRAADLAE
jgi:endonuclease YncB( thermonuclease family)